MFPGCLQLRSGWTAIYRSWYLVSSGSRHLLFCKLLIFWSTNSVIPMGCPIIQLDSTWNQHMWQKIGCVILHALMHLVLKICFLSNTWTWGKPGHRADSFGRGHLVAFTIPMVAYTIAIPTQIPTWWCEWSEEQIGQPVTNVLEPSLAFVYPQIWRWWFFGWFWRPTRPLDLQLCEGSCWDLVLVGGWCCCCFVVVVVVAVAVVVAVVVVVVWCCGLLLLGCWDVGMLGCWDVGMLGCCCCCSCSCCCCCGGFCCCCCCPFLFDKCFVISAI